MATAADVMCGTRIEPWVHFRMKRFWINTHSGFGKILVNLPPTTPNHPAPFAIIQGSRRYRSFTAEKDFLAILCHSRVCDAGDPRDKVFALYSFLSDAAERGLFADYSVTNTTALVYISTTEWLLKHCGLSVLSCVWGKLENRDKLPSWVPDWQNSRVRPEWHFAIPIRNEFRSDVDATFWPTTAAGQSNPCITFQDSGDGSRLLVVRGLIVDRIQHVGDILQQTGEDISQLAAQNRAKSGLSKVRYQHRTFNMRGKPNWFKEYGFPAHMNDASSWRSEEDTNLVWHHTVRERAIVASDSGYFGVVPDGTMTGDYLCILLGARVPFVMRRFDQYWQLLGEAYIYGLMAGEALVGKDIAGADGEVAKSPFVDFVIR